jgi:hypothetical protein
MGGCCSGGIQDQEIKEANNLTEIIQIFKIRKEKLPEERDQIQAHLEDPKKEVKVINTNGIDPEILKKRIPFLEDLEENYETVINLLTNNPGLPLKNVKIYCSNIASKYYLTYDPNKEVETEMNKLKTFVDQWQNNQIEK